MKLDRRTIEAFRKVNYHMKSIFFESAWGRYSYAYPEPASTPPAINLYVAGPHKRKLLIGTYLGEVSLRNSVETVAEFLEGVI